MRPKILCGEWYDDNWISPYVRAEFPVTGKPSTLHVTMYCPEIVGPTTAVIRKGHQALGRISDILPGETKTWDCPLDNPDTTHDTVSLSIRIETSICPGHDDNRELGLVLTEWYLD